MDSYSILGSLYKERNTEDVCFMPEYFFDLNLDQIMECIMAEKKEYNLKPYYYELAEDYDTINYRQNVLKELGNKELQKAIIDFSRELKKVLLYREYYEKNENVLQKERWYLDYHYIYCISVEKLYKTLVELAVTSKGFLGLQQWLASYIQTEEFIQVQKHAKDTMEQILKLKFCIQLGKEKVTIHNEISEDNYSEDICKLLHIENPMELDYVPSPFTELMELSELEQKMVEVLIRKDTKPFEKLATFVKECKLEVHPTLIRFEKEVQFYLAFIKFEEKLKHINFEFSFPMVCLENEFSVSGCYDVALSLKNGYAKKPVIRNDASISGKEKFLVITGPNQGGKTTFARSIGQCIYFALIGLKVPARELIMPYYRGLMTHFATEESNKTGEGKLMEELYRLQPMMKSEQDNFHKFVIMNELFTSAASYDAGVMGKRVMQYFIDKRCNGVYVTHIPELAEETDEVISMVALVDNEDQKIRTYKIARRPADGKGYTSSIVEKYDLSYAQLKVRLNGK